MKAWSFRFSGEVLWQQPWLARVGGERGRQAWKRTFVAQCFLSRTKKKYFREHTMAGCLSMIIAIVRLHLARQDLEI